MIKYLLGFIFNIFNPAVSLLCRIDNDSRVSKKARIYRGTQIYKSSIGDYSYAAPKSKLIDAKVGKFCSIGHESCIGMGRHTLNKLSTSPIFTEKNNSLGQKWVDKDKSVIPFQTINVGNDVWIGRNALIMGGVNIGNGAVVGAGAVVTKDIPPYAVVGGVPAKIIRYRFPEDIIKKLEEIQWWNLPEDILKSNIHLFQKEDINKDDLNILFCES